MPDTHEIRRLLRLAFEGDSMRGSLVDGNGRPHAFSGWLELLAAIEELRVNAQDRGRAGVARRLGLDGEALQQFGRRWRCASRYS
jgi:hypothetical protein